MKRLYVTKMLSLMTAVLMSTAIYAQTLNLWKDGAIIFQAPVTFIDSISFTLPNEPVNPPTPVVDMLDGTHQNPDYLYALDTVPEILITVTEANWNQYLSNFDNNPNNDLYVPAKFRYKKGNRILVRDSVGLRPRGNTSRRRPEGNWGEAHSANGQWHHAHFGVKFTEYTTGERFFGSDRIILKWFKEDPTYAREVFCYDLMRRFGVWSAPRCTYCRFSIQVEGDPQPVYMGVYELIENPRKGWLKNKKDKGLIADNNGNMWKANWGADLSNADQSRMGVEDDYTSYVYDLKLVKSKLEQAKQELADFINGLWSQSSGSAALKTWLEQHMDVDLFLRAMAVEAMVGHWDDFWANQNNYYFYFDSNHKFYYIPFDMDNTLGTGSSSFGNPGTHDLLQWGPVDNNRILIQRVMSVNEYKERYKQYILDLAGCDTLMAANASIARIQAFQNKIRNYVSNDTGEDMNINDYPASWGNYSGYRLLSGGIGDGEYNEANYFKTKINSISFGSVTPDDPEPETRPSVSAVNNSTIIVMYSPDVCQTVTLSGAYEWVRNSQTITASWGQDVNNNNNNYVNFTAISGWPGWYQATLKRPSGWDYTVKGVQLTGNGEFAWSNQWGYSSVTILDGNGAWLEENEWNEPQVKLNSQADVVYIQVSDWRGNLCQ